MMLEADPSELTSCSAALLETATLFCVLFPMKLEKSEIV